MKLSQNLVTRLLLSMLYGTDNLIRHEINVVLIKHTYKTFTTINLKKNHSQPCTTKSHKTITIFFPLDLNGLYKFLFFATSGNILHISLILYVISLLYSLLLQHSFTALRRSSYL